MRSQSGLGGHLGQTWRPRAPRRPSGRHFGPLGARFWRRGVLEGPRGSTEAKFEVDLSLTNQEDYQSSITERAVDKFSSFFPSGKGLKNMFRDLLGFWAVFSDSLAFSASIALFFVPKDLLGPDFLPKQNQKELENLSNTRSEPIVPKSRAPRPGSAGA